MPSKNYLDQLSELEIWGKEQVAIVDGHLEESKADFRFEMGEFKVLVEQLPKLELTPLPK